MLEGAGSTVQGQQPTHPLVPPPPSLKLAVCYAKSSGLLLIRCGSCATCSYLAGNFAPVKRALPLTPCSYEGSIPAEFHGGEYVRNGANPLTNDDIHRDTHWFDGDGMLTGVSFRRDDGAPGKVQPDFVNQFVHTDVYLSALTTPSLRAPILPSVATLVNPLSTIARVIAAVLRTVALVLLSRLWLSKQAIKKISVANTSVLYHDGRALATCESGPPMRVMLPGLETVGWFNGQSVEGEADPAAWLTGFGGKGFFSFIREWTTAHPRVDPVTSEFVAFHSSFLPPYVRYSVVPSTQQDIKTSPAAQTPAPMLGVPVPGMSSGKMMHDFGVSSMHTVIIDLPLTLDPVNMARRCPVIAYDRKSPTRFGVFPRRQPNLVRWFEAPACCIFHTANTWDETATSKDGRLFATAVNMLACRLNSSSLIYTTANIAPPSEQELDDIEQEDEQCRLYYYRFDMRSGAKPVVSHQWALSAIPFEFSSVRADRAMGPARYVFGCSSTSNFAAALGRASKIDALAKIDALTLIERGYAQPPRPVEGCVDNRSMEEVLRSTDPDDPIQMFPMPAGWYAQEPRFVPRRNGAHEDDGWLVFYAFDERQLDPDGHAPDEARSELWIIDARNMRDVVARVFLPQRVPYGLHGCWFDEHQIQGQRPIHAIRPVPIASSPSSPSGVFVSAATAAWRPLRNAILNFLG